MHMLRLKPAWVRKAGQSSAIQLCELRSLQPSLPFIVTIIIIIVIILHNPVYISQSHS